MLRPIVVLLACLMLAACGDDGSSEPPTIENVAAEVGCSGFEQNTEGQALTREIGSCQLDGIDIYVHTFSDADQQDQWMSIAPAGGGVLVEGDLWAAQTFDADVADKIAQATGATVAD